MKTTSFRWSADKQLRDAVCDFAADPRFANPWANQLYQQARGRGHRHPHAVRIVARAWLHVIWRCWQDHQPYDPALHRALHRALQAVLHRPVSPAEVRGLTLPSLKRGRVRAAPGPPEGAGPPGPVL